MTFAAPLRGVEVTPRNIAAVSRHSRCGTIWFPAKERKLNGTAAEDEPRQRGVLD
jgi:hypothetical protein